MAHLFQKQPLTTNSLCYAQTGAPTVPLFSQVRFIPDCHRAVGELLMMPAHSLDFGNFDK